MTELVPTEPEENKVPSVELERKRGLRIVRRLDFERRNGLEDEDIERITRKARASGAKVVVLSGRDRLCRDLARLLELVERMEAHGLTVCLG